MVERRKNQRFEDHLCPRPQGASLTMVGKNIRSKFIPGRVCLRDKWVGEFSSRFAWIKFLCKQLDYGVPCPAQCEFGPNVFPNHSQTSTLRTRTEMVFKTSVFSPLNHLTRLIARENFIILSRRESNKSKQRGCIYEYINSTVDKNYQLDQRQRECRR
jgi:hypothetical protein